MAVALPLGRQSLAGNAWLGHSTEAALQGPRIAGAVIFYYRPEGSQSKGAPCIPIKNDQNHLFYVSESRRILKHVYIIFVCSMCSLISLPLAAQRPTSVVLHGGDVDQSPYGPSLELLPTWPGSRSCSHDLDEKHLRCFRIRLEINKHIKHS